MNKEYLEETKEFLKKHCLQKCSHNSNENCICKASICFKEIEKVEQALQRLDAIENIKPSEALECLHKVASKVELADYDDYWEVRNAYAKVEQALIKAQEMEKALEIIKKKEVDMIHLLWCIDTYDSYINLIVYNEQVIEEEYKLTQEEFELLKRWLKC